jgi:hypothetical protein
MCRKSVQKREKSNYPPHPPLKLNEDQERSVLEFIQNGFTSGNYVTQREILNLVEERFQKTVTSGWLASFLDRWQDHIIRTVVKPQEQLRLQIPREYLNDYISLIKTYTPLVPAELIFNLDETGLSDWEERKAKPVIIQSHASQTALHYPIDRTVRHHTLLCCVSASGDAYCPFLSLPVQTQQGFLRRVSGRILT